MITFQEIARIIQRGNSKIMSRIFTDLIKENKTDERKELFDEYEGETLPIWDKKINVATEMQEPNNKLNQPYRELIVNQGVSYFLGIAVTRTITGKDAIRDGEKTINANLKKDEELQKFYRSNNIENLDWETGIYTSVNGTSGRLLYLNKDGEPKMMNIPAWQCVFVRNTNTDEIEYAMIYYSFSEIDVTKPEQPAREFLKIEWYDNKEVSYWIEEQKDEFVLDTDRPIKKHGFDYVPLIEYPNDLVKKGDFENVRKDIDAIDNTLSNAQDEIEKFRQAYLLLMGVTMSKKTLQEARETGTLQSTDTSFKAEWLIKVLDPAFIDSQKKALDNNIFRFSQRVDMSDEKFSGSGQTGESRKWKLVSLENDAIQKENNFRKSERELFRCLFSYWKKRKIEIDYTNMEWKFKRNIPVDLSYYGDVITKFWGKYPKKRIWQLLPFVDDIELILEEFEEEMSEMEFEEES